MLQFEACIERQEGSWACSWSICSAGKGELESAESASITAQPGAAWTAALSLTPPVVCKAFLHLGEIFSQMHVEILRLIWFCGGDRGFKWGVCVCVCLFLPSKLPFIAHLLVLEDNTLLTLREASVNKVCCTGCKAIWTFYWKGWTWF